MKKVAVLLAGSGVFDGSEIHEAVFSLLSISDKGMHSVCFAPDVDQFHVVNHRNGEVTDEKRNVLTESARIARGEISPLTEIQPEEFDALMIPGGFGAAKNLNQWAISGKDGPILPEVRDVIRKFLELQKPVAALCMGPTVVAKALEGTSLHPTLTVGSSSAPSPYDIQGIARGMESIGARVEMKTINQISVDLQNKIITAPCYMMEANISQVRDNVDQVVEELKRLI